ncbi:hypothetical protein [Nocardiopsis sp. JB363]|uniref:hypothetical protein n=1 Tax=Nocardiopsis sp. JB363 TaxID=1434837 RepID=UPI000B35A523|nr:hypothetical protein [Nocardiopsis sp. JB363]
MKVSLPVHEHPPEPDWGRITAVLTGIGAPVTVATHDGLALTYHDMAQEMAEGLASATPSLLNQSLTLGGLLGKGKPEDVLIRLAARQGWLIFSPATACTALVTLVGPGQGVDQANARISKAVDALEGLLPSSLPDRVGRMRVYRSVA